MASLLTEHLGKFHRYIMAILDFILGRPLASDEDKDERVGPLAGVSVFGLDAAGKSGAATADCA